jgi:bla regulator protein blaR1
MLAWMIYIELVTLVVGGAALAAEQALRARRAPSRWVWVTAMLASLLIAVIGGSAAVPASYRASPLAVATRQGPDAVLLPMRWLGDATRRTDEAIPDMDGWVRSGWTAGSAGALLFLCGSAANLHWRRRHWRRRTVAGVEVHVAPDLGPAVVGFLRPAIVVPEWIDELPAAQQRLIIAHERAHLQARDPQALALALCLLVCMPWNAVLCWQMRRLRRAIEVDRDLDILGSGAAAREYGETLLAVGQRQSASMGTVLAMSEPKSFLEERISLMLRKPSRSWVLASVAFSGLSLALVAAATQVSPPGKPARTLTGASSGSVPADTQRVEVAAAVLDGYAGDYQYGDAAVTTVTRAGDHLVVQFPGWPALPMYPRTATTFFSADTDATVSFTAAANGAAPSAVLQQNGASTPMPRIDAATARRLHAAMQARVQQQAANPASAAALRRMIDSISAGSPHLTGMNPQLAAAIAKDLPKLQAKLATLGPVQSIQAQGVSDAGMDVYEVHHAHGSSQWSLALDSRGTIVGAMVPL